MDSELRIATHNSIPNQEYALYGSILDGQVETLIHRLKGLCGTMPGNGDPFEDHYLTYTFKHVTPHISVRAVRSITYSAVPWRFQYYGEQGGSDPNRLVTQRQIIDACCSVRLPKFLEDGLGFTVDAEYIFKGYAFAKGKVKILVGKIMKHFMSVWVADSSCSGSQRAAQLFLHNGEALFADDAEHLTVTKRRKNEQVGKIQTARDPNGGVEAGEAVTGSHLVEVSAVSFGGTANEPSSSDVLQFAELLQPIVKLERIDFKKLGAI